jgi:hypothetical protein
MVESHYSELIAGGNWNNAGNCRSRCRNLNNYQWNVNSNISSQLLTRIQGFCELNPLAGLLTLFV